jgi:hypothetical protein
MMWFDKQNPDVIFADKRKESHILCDGRALEINPDIIMDFRDMDYPDNTFSLVVFDPPHLNRLGETSWMAKKYGILSSDWEVDIKQGFDECMRVLKVNGTLIFKWNETQVKLSEVLKAIETKPLFGHTTGRQAKTIWLCFMKST